MTTDLFDRRMLIQQLAAGAVALPLAAAAAEPLFGYAAQPPAKAAAQKKSALAAYTFNVRDFGAVPDGKSLCTAAMAGAVAAATRTGGGKVIVPPGKYLTGPIFLQSNLEFEVMTGATLIAAHDLQDYPTVAGRWEGINRTVYASLFTGTDLENVTLSGGGVLDGQGEFWWDLQRKTFALRRSLGLDGREPENPPDAPLRWPRPRMIHLIRCRNVRISGLTIQNSPSWNVHPVLCQEVWMDGLRILSHEDSMNTDGIDPDSCSNVIISNCFINVGDDCIVIKSGYRYQPGNPYPPCENIVVTNCVFKEGHGGVVIGSETAGGVRNVAISNCVCDGTDRGLRFKTGRGRGNVVENIRASNVVMRDIAQAAIEVQMFYEPSERSRPAPFNQFTPTFRNFHFSDIVVASARRAMLVEGLPESPMQSLSVRNLEVQSAQNGILCSTVRGLALENVTVRAAAGVPVALTSVHDVELRRVRSANPGSKEPAIRLERVQSAMVESCTADPGPPALVEVQGAECSDVQLALNRPAKGSEEVAFSGGASAAAVTRRA
jgi:polygalacturonase